MPSYKLTVHRLVVNACVMNNFYNSLGNVSSDSEDDSTGFEERIEDETSSEESCEDELNDVTPDHYVQPSGDPSSVRAMLPANAHVMLDQSATVIMQ